MNHRLAALALFALLLPLVATANPADPDPAFGSGGRVMTDVLSGFDTARDLLRLPDGRIVVAGNATPSGGASQFLLARYLADGQLDTTFGVHGVTTTSFPASTVEATSLARQSDGRYVVAGYTQTTGVFSSAIARYDTSGVLDTSFGTGGRVTQTIGAEGYVWDALVQPDDKIVIAGAFRITGTITFMGLRRYLPSGAIDPTFGANGTVTRGPGVDNRCNAIALADSGKIVAAGSTQLTAGADQFLTFRFRSNGTPDSMFATFGRAITSLSPFRHFATNVIVLADGGVISGGYAGAAANLSHRYAVARFLPNGTLDPSFGTGGLALTPEVGITTGFAFLEDMVRTPSGKLLLVGQGTNLGTSDDFALARMTESGGMDGTFGAGGLAYADLSGGGRDVAYAALLQPDGRILLAGSAGGSLFPGGPRVGLARFLGDEPNVGADPAAEPGRLELAAPRPNPSRGAASVAYRLGAAAHVTLSVFDVQGREVAVLERGERPAGEHRAAWNGLDRAGAAAPAGLYFCRLDAAPAAGGAPVHATQRVVRIR